MTELTHVNFNSDAYVPVDPRPLTDREQAVLAAVIKRETRWRDVLTRQAANAQVTMEATRTPSIVLTVDRQSTPPVADNEVRTEFGHDRDGMYFEVLLFMRGGYIDELFIWRGDLAVISAWPDPNTWWQHENE